MGSWNYLSQWMSEMAPFIYFYGWPGPFVYCIWSLFACFWVNKSNVCPSYFKWTSAKLNWAEGWGHSNPPPLFLDPSACPRTGLTSLEEKGRRKMGGSQVNLRSEKKVLGYFSSFSLAFPSEVVGLGQRNRNTKKGKAGCWQARLTDCGLGNAVNCQLEKVRGR